MTNCSDWHGFCMVRAVRRGLDPNAPDIVMEAGMRTTMQSRGRRATVAVVAALAFAGTGVTAQAAPIVFSVGGSSATASIQATVDSFRAALGDPNNGNAAGPLASGRREINWD